MIQVRSPGPVSYQVNPNRGYVPKQNTSLPTAMSQTSQRVLQYAMFYNDIAIKMSYASLRHQFRWLRMDFLVTVLVRKLGMGHGDFVCL